MNTKFYKEFQDKYPTILGSDRNISYTQFLEEMVTELQQQVKLFAIPVVSNNEVAVCSFEDKCCLYQESNCNQKTCGDFHKQTDC